MQVVIADVVVPVHGGVADRRVGQRHHGRLFVAHDAAAGSGGAPGLAMATIAGLDSPDDAGALAATCTRAVVPPSLDRRHPPSWAGAARFLGLRGRRRARPRDAAARRPRRRFARLDSSGDADALALTCAERVAPPSFDRRRPPPRAVRRGSRLSSGAAARSRPGSTAREHMRHHPTGRLAQPRGRGCRAKLHRQMTVSAEERSRNIKEALACILHALADRAIDETFFDPGAETFSNLLRTNLGRA